MADPVVKFEPYMTAREPGGSLILDRNLIEIKKALADANATFITIKNTLNEVISSINVTFAGPTVAATPPGIDMGSDSESDMPMFIPGPTGQKGDSVKGPPGIPGDDADADAVLIFPGATTIVQAQFWLVSGNAGLPNSSVLSFPAAKEVLISAGTSTAPTGTANFQYDTATDILSLGTGVLKYHMNLGTTPTGNYEAIQEFWSSNVFNFLAVKGGTGTIRAMKLSTTAGVTIDEMLNINGAVAANNAALTVASTTNTARDHVKFFVGGGANWDSTNTWFDINVANTSFTGTVGIWASQRIRTATYTGSSSPVMTEATSLYIDGAPAVSGFSTSQYAIHVAAGLVQCDGNFSVVSGGVATMAAGGGAKISWFGNALVGQQTVTGSRGGNAALASLLAALATNYGLVVDSTSP